MAAFIEIADSGSVVLLNTDQIVSVSVGCGGSGTRITTTEANSSTVQRNTAYFPVVTKYYNKVYSTDEPLESFIKRLADCGSISRCGK